MKLFVISIVIELIIVVCLYFNQKPKKGASSVDPDPNWELADALPVITTGTTFLIVDVVWAVALLLFW